MREPTERRAPGLPAGAFLLQFASVGMGGVAVGVGGGGVMDRRLASVEQSAAEPF